MTFTMSAHSFDALPRQTFVSRVAALFATPDGANVRARPRSAAAHRTAGGACGCCGAPVAPGGSTADIELLLRAEQARTRDMERAFAQYVPSQVIERLMADPDGLSLGGESRDVTVLFADLRGFSALAETMKTDPRRLTAMISAVLDPLTDIVLAHSGTIDKYMGDCVMAFWGAPADDPDHARHAFDAAQAMLAAVTVIDAGFRAAFAGEIDLPPIRIGIGLNTGECVVGNLGSHKRFDYSVLGDPVNVASRLEGLCKTYDAPLMVGEETARRLGADAGLIEIDRIALRGRSEPQGVFALAERAGASTH